MFIIFTTFIVNINCQTFFSEKHLTLMIELSSRRQDFAFLAQKYLNFGAKRNDLGMGVNQLAVYRS